MRHRNSSLTSRGRNLGVIATVLLLLCGAAVAGGPKIERTQVQSGGKKRTYYCYVPETAKAGPAPLLLLLHGSGHAGDLLVQNWKGEADKQGIILVGPDSNDPRSWDSSVDSPDFLRDVIVDVMANHDVDPQRLYIFGHSGGAMYGILLGLMESNYFAAVGVHAGALQQAEYVLISNAQRKIPIGLWSGRQDDSVPIDEVKRTYEELQRQGFPTVFHPIPNHTHNYYAMADVVNSEIWEYLKDKRNESPEFTQYDWSKAKKLPGRR